ncbi:hypothetical protein [Streptomyces anulatus]|uniref:hypothetical protein n=1 Tax=Streptomyces anulatus TaxID=1892 RepID=UPI00343D79BA
MTTLARRSAPDRPCVLPGDWSWIKDAQYLDDQVLRSIAGAAMAADDGTYVLAPLTYEIAATTIGNLATSQRPAAQLHVMSLPA